MRRSAASGSGSPSASASSRRTAVRSARALATAGGRSSSSRCPRWRRAPARRGERGHVAMVEPKTRILVVDDEVEIRRALRSTLKAHGFEVVEAGSAREASQHATAYNPDLLLIDLGLPDRDGLELIRELRGWCRAPILILSARDRE